MTQKAFRHPDGNLELVDVITSAAEAIYLSRGYVEVNLAAARVEAAAADAARLAAQPKTREQKLIDALLAKGVISPADLD